MILHNLFVSSNRYNMFHLYHTEIDNVTHRQTLDDIDEIGIPVVTTPSELFHMTSPLLSVLVSTVSAVCGDQHPTGAEQPEDDGVPLDERRSLFGGVDERGRETSTIGDGQLQTDGRGTLVVRRRVVGKPDEDRRDCGRDAIMRRQSMFPATISRSIGGFTCRVQAGRHQEQCAILDLVVIGRTDDGVTDDRKRDEREHDGSTDTITIGHEGGDD